MKPGLGFYDVSCLMSGVMVPRGVSVLQIVIYYNCKAHTKLISNDNHSTYYFSRKHKENCRIVVNCFFEENKKTILNQQPIGGRWRVIIDIIEETVK